MTSAVLPARARTAAAAAPLQAFHRRRATRRAVAVHRLRRLRQHRALALRNILRLRAAGVRHARPVVRPRHDPVDPRARAVQCRRAFWRWRRSSGTATASPSSGFRSTYRSPRYSSPRWSPEARWSACGRSARAMSRRVASPASLRSSAISTSAASSEHFTLYGRALRHVQGPQRARLVPAFLRWSG